MRQTLQSSALHDVIPRSRRAHMRLRRPPRSVSLGKVRPEKSAFDGNGNVRALVKADAANPAASGIVERYAYDGFGREIVAPSSISRLNSFAFSTKCWDAETGMNYYGYRFYDANNGRWINRDPVVEKGELNVYAMAGNDIVCSFDFLGLLTKAECAELFNSIRHKAVEFWKNWGKYSPEADAKSWPYFNKGTKRVEYTSPGGHYKELIELQSGLKKDITRYIKECTKDCNDDNKRIHKSIENASSVKIPEPLPTVKMLFVPDYNDPDQVNIIFGGGGLIHGETPVFEPIIEPILL